MTALPPSKIEPVADVTLIEPWLAEDLSLAAVNAPDLHVVSGLPEAVAALKEELGRRGVACRALPASRAFHSKAMEPVARDLARQLPAFWQESIKQGRRWTFAKFLEAAQKNDDLWFWRSQCLPKVLSRWGSGLEPDHVHLVTVPQPGGGARVLYPDVPNNYRTRLDLQWPIYTGGRTDALERAARAEAAAVIDPQLAGGPGPGPILALAPIAHQPGKSWPAEEEEKFKAPIRDQYERQGSPYYSTARLWDDGVIDPVDTRRVLGMGLAAASHAPIPAPSYGVFRM